MLQSKFGGAKTKSPFFSSDRSIMAKAAAKKDVAAQRTKPTSWWRDQPLTSMLFAVGLLGAMTWFCWQQVGPSLQQRGDYRLELHEIELTPRPSYIFADVRAEALRDASLDPPLQLLDQQLLPRLEKAFAMHPWVEKVESLQVIYPAHLKVQLNYRRPVVMIEVANGLLPVDQHGIQLPPRDFDKQANVADYPRIVGVAGGPLTPLGTTWADPVVIGGAAIAGPLREIWSTANLARIRWIPEAPVIGQSGRYFVLETRQGGTLIWGQAPGRELPNELPAAEKISALKSWLAAPGGLAEKLGSNTLDLRDKANWPK